MTSDLQDEGTKNRTALEISQDLKSIGTNLSTRSSFDGSNVSMNTLKKHMAKSLEIFADIITNAAFPQEELDRKKEQYQTRILQEKSQPFTVSIKELLENIARKRSPLRAAIYRLGY